VASVSDHEDAICVTAEPNKLSPVSPIKACSYGRCDEYETNDNTNSP